MLRKLRPVGILLAFAALALALFAWRAPRALAEDGPELGACPVGTAGTLCPPGTAKITIIKDHITTLQAGDLNRKFKFSSDLGSFKLSDGQQEIFNDELEVGETYLFKEKSLGDNQLTDINCVVEDDAGGNLIGSVSTNVDKRRVFITVQDGSNIVCTFVNQHEAEIIVYKYEDILGNGVKDGADGYLKGWTINLDDGDDDHSRKTKDNGIARFSGLKPGVTYTICENVMNGWIQTGVSIGNVSQPLGCVDVKPDPGQGVPVFFGNHKIGGGGGGGNDDDDDDDDDLAAVGVVRVAGLSSGASPDIYALTSDGPSEDDLYPEGLDEEDVTNRVFIPFAAK